MRVLENVAVMQPPRRKFEHGIASRRGTARRAEGFNRYFILRHQSTRSSQVDITPAELSALKADDHVTAGQFAAHLPGSFKSLVPQELAPFQ